MTVGQANVNDRSTRPSGHVVNIEHVMTHDNGIERRPTSVPVRSSCRQNKQTVAGEQVDELSSVGVAVALLWCRRTATAYTDHKHNTKAKKRELCRVVNWGKCCVVPQPLHNTSPN